MTDLFDSPQFKEAFRRLAEVASRHLSVEMPVFQLNHLPEFQGAYADLAKAMLPLEKRGRGRPAGLRGGKVFNLRLAAMALSTYHSLRSAGKSHSVAIVFAADEVKKAFPKALFSETSMRRLLRKLRPSDRREEIDIQETANAATGWRTFTVCFVPRKQYPKKETKRKAFIASKKYLKKQLR